MTRASKEEGEYIFAWTMILSILSDGTQRGLLGHVSNGSSNGQSNLRVNVDINSPSYEPISIAVIPCEFTREHTPSILASCLPVWRSVSNASSPKDVARMRPFCSSATLPPVYIGCIVFSTSKVVWYGVLFAICTDEGIPIRFLYLNSSSSRSRALVEKIIFVIGKVNR